MKPKLRMQCNSQQIAEVHNYVKVAEGIEILVKENPSTSSETKLKWDTFERQKNGLSSSNFKVKQSPSSSSIKQEPEQALPKQIKCASNSPELNFKICQEPVPHFMSKRMGSKLGKDVKDLITYTPLVKNEELNGKDCNGSSKCDSPEPDKVFNESTTVIKPEAKRLAKRLLTNLTPQALLPASKGKRISPVVNRNLLNSSKPASLDSKGFVNSKLSKESTSKNVSSQDSIPSNFFYKSQVTKVEMNEADIPPFTPHAEIGCSDIANISPDPEIIYIKTTQSTSRVRKVEKRDIAKCALKRKQEVEHIKRQKKNSITLSAKKTGHREINQLYKNLQEISWAQDKEFKTLLNTSDGLRHAGRTSNADPKKSASEGKRKKVTKLVVEPKKRNIKLCQVKPKLKNTLSALARKKVLKSAKIARSKEISLKKPKKTLNAKVTKAKVKKFLVNQTAKTKPLVSRLKDVPSKKSPEAKFAPKAGKKVAPKPTTKPINPSKTTSDNAQSASSTSVNFEHILQKLNALGSLFQNTDGNRLLFALNKGQELRVRLEPLESSDLWPSDFDTRTDPSKQYSAFTNRTIQENVLKVFAGLDQSKVNMMLQDIPEASASSSCDTRNPKKRKHEEECVRASLRQNYKEIVVKKQNNYVQIILVPSSNKQNSLTIEAMRELKDAFQYARKDPHCKAVLINSSGTYFCTGIDLSQLYGANKKHAAEEMAQAIRDLILTMAVCPKPIVAAVNGCTVGLGVSMLTYCDIVLASDKASFCLPSARMGYIPEGGVALTLPQVVGSSVALEMLLHGRKLTARQAFKHGLVSEVIWPAKLMEEVVPRMLSLVEQSLPVMEATKTMVRCHLWEKLATQMNREWHLLPAQWLSSECQQNIKHHMKSGWLLD